MSDPHGTARPEVVKGAEPKAAPPAAKGGKQTLRRKVEIRVDGQVLVICTWYSKFFHCFRDFCENPKFVDGFFLFISSNTKVFGGNSICSKSFFWWIALVIGKAMICPQSIQMGWPFQKIIWTMVHTKRKMSWTLQNERYQRWVLLHCYLLPFIVYIFRSGFQIHWDKKVGVGEFWK